MLAAKQLSSELKRSKQSLIHRGKKREFAPSRFLALEDLAVFHYELHILQCFDVMQRIAADRNYVGKRPWRNHSDLAFHFEHGGGPRGCALDSVHWLHAQIHHARKLLCDRLAPWNSTHVCAEHDLHSTLECLLERLLMHRSPQPVALPGRRVRRSPIGVIDADRRDVPGALLQHLGNRGIVEIEAMFDRVASTVQRPAQADTAINVTRDLLAPAVSFVHDGSQLLDRERGL